MDLQNLKVIKLNKGLIIYKEKYTKDKIVVEIRKIILKREIKKYKNALEKEK